MTSEDHDLGPKVDLYARHRIPEYWVAVVPSKTVRVYRSIRMGRYAAPEVLSGDDVLSPLAAPDISVRVADLF